jgi:hypothetical protein
MRLNEILTEDQELQEGPLLNKIGTGIGKAVGGVAKAAGAVAGGIAGLGAAAKKGFQAGKQTVAGAGDEPAAGGNTAAPAAAGSGGGAPAAASSGGAQTQTLANPKDPNTGTAPAADSGPPKSNTPFGRLSQAAAGQDPDDPAQPAAAEKPAAGATPGTQEKPAAAAAAPTAEKPAAQEKQPAAEQPAANDAAFQKVQQNIGKLPPEQQKELMAALMADPEVKKALEQPAPASDAEQQTAVTPAAQPETPAAAPAAADQAAAKPGRQRDAKGRFIGKNAPRANPAPTQAEIDADRERLLPQTGESKKYKGNALTENAAEPTQTPQQQRQDSLKTFSAIQQGFERGRRDPFGNSDRQVDVDQEPDIVDKSNTVPRGIVSALNTLSKDQRNELFKKLKAKLI